MMYRKFTADALFTGYEFLTGGEVLVTDEYGKITEIVSGSGISDAEHFNGTLSPGFINAHCHLELSWMKNLIPRKTGMIDFLIGVMQKPRLPANEINKAIVDAEQQMLNSGIIAVGDICNTSLTVPQKKDGNIYYHNFIEAMGFVEAFANQRFDQAVKVFNDFASLYPLPVSCNSIVPHSPYSVSQKLFKKIVSFPGNQLLSIHNQEHASENEFFMEGTGDFHRLLQVIGVDSSFHKGSGKTSLQHYLPWFMNNQKIILVHNVETGREDLTFINDMKLKGLECWLCLCPNANLFINDKLPDLLLISRYSENIIVGTDSLASNSQLNILEELKTLHVAFPSFAIRDLLRWATVNGAKALNIEEEAGSFEKGKQPGIVLIKGLSPGSIMQDAVSSRIL